MSDENAWRGEIAYRLTQRHVLDMPSARAIVDEVAAILADRVAQPAEPVGYRVDWLEHGLGRERFYGVDDKARMDRHTAESRCRITPLYAAPQVRERALEDDARRYRWLRDPENSEGPNMVARCSPDELDAEIDAAMKERP